MAFTKPKVLIRNIEFWIFILLFGFETLPAAVSNIFEQPLQQL